MDFAAYSRTLSPGRTFGMSDDSHNQGTRTSDRESFERRYFLEGLAREFPGKPDTELEVAYDTAVLAIAPSEDREKLTAKIHEILDE